MPNAALLGGFAAMTRVVSLESVTAAIRGRFSGQAGEGNAAAAEEAYSRVAAHFPEPCKCLGSWKARALSRRPSRSAGPR